MTQQQTNIERSLANSSNLINSNSQQSFDVHCYTSHVTEITGMPMKSKWWKVYSYLSSPPVHDNHLPGSISKEYNFGAWIAAMKAFLIVLKSIAVTKGPAAI